MEIAYLTLDVFTDRVFGGNPLAVIPDARGLSNAQMQAIAREFNYSEQTFVLPPADPANTARVRIFTPASEIPFAGHPNVGTAIALARRGSAFGRAVGDHLRFEETAGLVDCTLAGTGAAMTAEIAAPEPFSRGPEIPPERIAACIGLDPSAVARHRFVPQSASVGLRFAFAELVDLDALAAARPDPAAFTEADRHHPLGPGRFSLHLHVRTAPGAVRARMFAPLSGIPEDPATGSAAGALAALLAAVGATDPAAPLVIDQGVEMGRPSRITVTLPPDGRPRIAGTAVPVMEGRITL
jgi:trans-2,3-dihydro-3-hydroxyanthranilate isomerase